jgi:exonuclease III
VVLGAVYGPNENDLEFFTDLENKLVSVNCTDFPTSIGGDWNATWDPRPANINGDVINMINIPSRARSEKINEIANRSGLTDPYRILHPVKKEFTYIPNARMNLNRSRIPDQC